VKAKSNRTDACVRIGRTVLILMVALLISGIGLTVTSGESAAAVLAADSASASANSADLKAILVKLQRHYQETDSFSATFKQTVTRVGAPPKVRTGTVYFEKPGRWRFDFSDPQPETIVSDGKLLYDYDPGLNQVMETPLKSALKTQAAAAFLLGVGSVQRDFKAEPIATPANDGLTHLLMTPKQGGEDIAVALDPHTMNIIRLRLADALGNITEFQFSRIDTNISIESSRFEFRAPDGADVITPSNVR
jgi:outer membrane lipoprotein carrier protein